MSIQHSVNTQGFYIIIWIWLSYWWQQPCTNSASGSHSRSFCWIE